MKFLAPLACVLLFAGEAFAARSLTFNPASSLAIPATRVGQTNTGQITVRSTSTNGDTVTIATMTVGSPFAVTSGTNACADGTVLAPNATCIIYVVHSPQQAASNNTSTLVVRHNAPNTNTATNITVSSSATQSTVNPTTAALDFGSVQQGVPTQRTQTVTNSGNNTLNFSSFAFSGTGAGDYAVSGCTGAVNAGSSCSLTVTFTPSTTGSRPASLVAASDASNGALTVTLAGTGVALPEPSLSPSTGDYPDTVIGQTSPTVRTFTIGNARVRPIGYTVTAPTDYEIGTESCGTRTVPGNGSCTVQVRFRPGATGGEARRTGTVNFTFTGTSGEVAPQPATVTVGGNALFPVALSATAVSPSANVGTPTTSTVVVNNRSTSSITLSSITYGGGQASDYSLDSSSTCTVGGVINAGASCNLITRFDPPTTGPRLGTIAIAHNGSAGSPLNVALNGTGLARLEGSLALSATTLALDSTVVGSSSSKNLTITNNGQAAVDFSAFDLTGASAAEFATSGSCSTSAALGVGASCTLTVTVTPAQEGTRRARLTILSSATNASVSVGLSGLGTAAPQPVVQLSSVSVNFGTQTVGQSYPSRSVVLRNSGTSNLAIAGMAISDAIFTDVSSAPCPANLSPGATCTIEVTFAPTAARSYVAELAIESNAPGSPHRIALSGNGSTGAVAILALSPAVTTVDFGRVFAGAVSETRTLTLINGGGASLTLDSFLTLGSTAFTASNGTCALNGSLSPGATCTVQLVFAPSEAGDARASFQAASTAGGVTPAVILTGSGADVPVSIVDDEDSGCSAAGAPALWFAALAMLLLRRRART